MDFLLRSRRSHPPNYGVRLDVCCGEIATIVSPTDGAGPAWIKSPFANSSTVALCNEAAAPSALLVWDPRTSTN